MLQFVDWFQDQSVYVADVGLSCCGVETQAAIPQGAARIQSELDQLPLTPSRSTHIVLVFSGTLTCVLSSRITEITNELTVIAEGADVTVTVIAFGACLCEGGPYWDSYSVTAGVDQLIHVDYYIPGCPPHPQSLAAVIEQIRHGRQCRQAVSIGEPSDAAGIGPSLLQPTAST